jgi:hypothetical protein
MLTRIKSRISAIVLFAVLCLAVFPSFPVMGKEEVSHQQATTQQVTTPQAPLPYPDIFFSLITNEIENLTWDTIVHGIDFLSSDTTDDTTESELQDKFAQITEEIAHVQQTEQTIQQRIDHTLAHIEQEVEQASVASLASQSDTAPLAQSVHLEDIHAELIEQLQQMTKMPSPMPSEPGPLVWETGIDVASTTKSAYDFSKEPTLKNGAYLAWDVAATLIPGAPGSWVKKAADKATEVAKNDKVQDALVKIKEYVGEDAKLTKNKSGDHVLTSKDETKKVRFDINNPHPHQNGHGHVEEKKPNSKNWWKSGPIYPFDVKPK